MRSINYEPDLRRDARRLAVGLGSLLAIEVIASSIWFSGMYFLTFVVDSQPFPPITEVFEVFLASNVVPLVWLVWALSGFFGEWIILLGAFSYAIAAAIVGTVVFDIRLRDRLGRWR